MKATREQYEELIQNRPDKFTPEQVDYAPANSNKLRCGRCLHFFTRNRDGFHVCEILRSEQIDADGINPFYDCRFFTEDGEHFPLLEN